MRELFVEKVIDTTGEFLDNNQRIKLKEILTEICLNYHIENLEKLRDTCSNLRDLAILELLISIGMRVGELTRLNIITD